MRKLTTKLVPDPKQDKLVQWCVEVDKKGKVINQIGRATSLLVYEDIHKQVKEYQEGRGIHQIQASTEIIEIGLATIKLFRLFDNLERQR
ncbi:MAG: hypothetical protein AABZ11_07975 [Nitrospinota bacterium]